MVPEGKTHQQEKMFQTAIDGYSDSPGTRGTDVWPGVTDPAHADREEAREQRIGPDVKQGHVAHRHVPLMIKGYQMAQHRHEHGHARTVGPGVVVEQPVPAARAPCGGGAEGGLLCASGGWWGCGASGAAGTRMQCDSRIAGLCQHR